MTAKLRHLGTIILALAVAMIGTALPAHATGTVHGCPQGAVCIYPQNAGWSGDRPSLVFSSYGPHNLSNQIGHHYVLNNQYRDQGLPALLRLCRGYNATSCLINPTLVMYGEDSRQGHSWVNYDLTPINSVLLFNSGP